jgi:hypothetical protein
MNSTEIVTQAGYDHKLTIGVAAYLTTQEYLDLVTIRRDFSTTTIDGTAVSYDFADYSLRVLNDRENNPGDDYSYLDGHVDYGLSSYRKCMADRGVELPVDDSELVKEMKRSREEFAAEIKSREGELEQYKAEFMQIAITAAANNNLPLTVEQIRQRIEDVIVVFGNKDQVHKGESGGFSRFDNSATITIGRSPEMTRVTTFHELMHALGGIRITSKDTDPASSIFDRINIRSSGFNTTCLSEDGSRLNKRNTATDEGFVQAIAHAWAEGIEIDFEATGQDAVLQWRRLNELSVQKSNRSYPEEQIINSYTFDRISMSTVANAYFKSDFDELEPDRLARAHAQKELQREIKHNCGDQRIVELREVDTLLRSGNDATGLAFELAMADIRRDAVGRGPIRENQGYNRIRRNTGIQRARDTARVNAAEKRIRVNQRD